MSELSGIIGHPAGAKNWCRKVEDEPAMRLGTHVPPSGPHMLPNQLHPPRRNTVWWEGMAGEQLLLSTLTGMAVYVAY